MKKAIGLLVLALGLLVLGSSASWALYQLAYGTVYYDSVPQENAYVQGCNINDTKVTDITDIHGCYGLARESPDFVTGYWDLCTHKSGVGKATYQIYYQGTPVWHNFDLSGSGTCGDCPSGK